MLTIQVATINGAPPAAPMTASFDHSGGVIGRDPACSLVLPDSEKRISRRHALISCRNGQYRLSNQGSAIAVLHNGRVVDFGAEVALADGDALEIGEFALRVTVDPGEITRPQGPAASPTAKGDLLAGFAAGGAALDPFADLIPAPPPTQRPSPAPPPARGRAAPNASAPEQIPDDFDPFGEPLTPTAAPAQSPGLPGDFRDLLPHDESVDDLFGLGKGGDPFPTGHPLSSPSAAATGGPVGIDDLLRPGAGDAVRPSSAAAPVQRDDASELSAHMRLPEVARVQAPPAQTAREPDAEARSVGDSSGARLPSPETAPDRLQAGPPAARPGQRQEEVAGGGMMLSWELGGGAGAEDVHSMVVGAAMGRRRTDRPPTADAPIADDAAVRRAEVADAALLQALIEGLGLERWPDGRPIDADAMRRVGTLLRAAVQGTIDLLRARATIKSEVQAQMTMIVSRDNNPLKFSPNVEAALTHLLGAAQRGFMSAPAAMEDAYRDLIAHQFGFTAGTRAALADVLGRFDPATLEQRLAAKSVLDSLLPANRKAKLWDLFTERFRQISSEAEDDFHRLFGKEFLRAYEEQVDRMSAPEAKGKG